MRKVISKILILAMLISLISSINVNAYYKSGYYTYGYVGGKLIIIDVNTNLSGVVQIPSQINGDNVSIIGENAFAGCSKITEVIIPETVTEIEERAFYACSALKSVSLPSKITYIGESTFHHCDSLTSISIPDSVTSIGPNAFTDCIKLSKVNMPNSLTSIDKYAFSYCSNMTEIIIPESVNRIGNYAFLSCKALDTVLFKGGLPGYIGIRVFDSCDNDLKIYCFESSGGWKSDSLDYDTEIIKKDIGIFKVDINTVKVVAKKFDNTTVQGIMAMYVDDKLIETVKSTYILDEAIGEMTFELNDKLLNDCDDVKIMLWDGLNSMKPLSESI